MCVCMCVRCMSWLGLYIVVPHYTHTMLLLYVFDWLRVQAELMDGEVIAHCPSCSLIIKVIYDQVWYSHTCTHHHTHAHIHIPPHTHTHTYTHIHTYTHTHVFLMISLTPMLLTGWLCFNVHGKHWFRRRWIKQKDIPFTAWAFH